ncbi:HTH domain-containing protein [Natronococcus occultus]|uniref:Uncharacterized protein n=1 Tax=Natronococcus occultus SP4 TaxID=694430 RepID=L0K267_9EURY|nr:HTH domain-containing protein [Natronococcus occultus]AGB38650.1 hypothetical protein Natoc_2892 [Natronococcus occultus SP4]
MSAGERSPVPTGNADLEDALRVDCYVRPSVPTAVEDVIETVADRLEELCRDGSIEEYRIVRWPPAGAAAPAADTSESSRERLVDSFERWAEDATSSLEPAFRRRTVPPSPLRPDGDDLERVRVPLVALALYEAGDGDDSAEETTLRGVVPHTDRTATGADRTYTVEEWLATAEHVDAAADGTARSEQAPLPEGGR